MNRHTPIIRSGSIQIFLRRERSDLRHTVEVMADLGLTYNQLKSLEGTYQYQLEPDISQLCNFEGMLYHTASHDFPSNSFKFFQHFSATTKSIELTYSNMQIIAREVELEMMRRSAPRQTSSDNQKTGQNTRNRALPPPNKPNHLQRLITKPIVKVKETVNCFEFKAKFI